MANNAGRATAPKLSKEDKKALRAAKSAKRRETWSNLKQAFSLTRSRDPKFLPLMIMVTVLAAAVVYVIAFFALREPYLPIPIAIVFAAVAGMFFFSRRAQKTMYAQAEGQAGAAGWMLKQQLRRDWRLTEAVAGTTQLDAVHRLVGRPGVVLVGEGAPHRVKGLIAQEKKRTARVVGDTPIYDVIIGTGEGDVRLSKINRYLLKLPNNISKGEIATLEKRLAALNTTRAAMPQGPVPQGAKMRNVARTVRRRT